MQNLFKMGGMEVFNFIIDYKLPGGLDAHETAQVICRNKGLAVQSTLERLRQEGIEIQCIVHVPGDYSTHDLDAFTRHIPPGIKCEVLYLNAGSLAQ